MSDAPYDYIRNFYGVPARLGGRVKSKLNGEEGELVPPPRAAHYCHVRFASSGDTVFLYHPSDLEYLANTEVS